MALDFNVIHHWLDRKGIVGEQFDQMITDMSVIERAALAHIHDGK